MAHETARVLLGRELERLQAAMKSTEREIAHAKDQLHMYERKREALKAESKDVGTALNKLGGPAPNWTEDKALIAFWDEVKDT